MGAKPETKRVVRSVVSVEVEDVRVWEDVFVSVGGLVRGNNTFTCVDGLYVLSVKLLVHIG